MKRIIIVILLSFFNTFSFSQGMYGFNIGLGRTMSYHSYITPAFEGYHLWRLSPHFYAGGAISLQRYSFLYDAKPAPAALNYGDIISIRQKSTFLFFSPKIDYGIGYRKYVHISLAAGAGIAIAPVQWENEYSPLLATAGGGIGADTSRVNTSYNVAHVIYRVGVGVSERIPTHGYFNIVLSQEFSYLANKLNRSGTDLTTSYFAFTVGFMHKYPQVWVQD